MADREELTVSIITPSYNSSSFVAEMIESVLRQTHTQWELIITDDCSTDRSIEIIERYRKTDARIKLIRLPDNSGSGIARNTSIERASGDVIAFLDSDDLWDSGFLEESLRFMRNKEAAIVFSSYRRASEDLSEELGVFVVPARVDYNSMLKSCAISCLTGMYHVERCGGKVFMPPIRKRQDYCLWLTLLKKTRYAYGLPSVLATYRVRSDSVSRNKIKAAQYQWHVYRKIEDLPMVLAGYYFCHYTIKGLLKNIPLIYNTKVA